MLPKSSSGHPYHSHLRYTIPSLLHYNLASLVLVWVVQGLLLLSASQTAGVTHWKLIDNEIMPEPQDLDTPGESQGDGGSKQDSGVHPMNQGQLSTTDPEFSMLVRYSARNSGGRAGSPNRGGGGYGIYQRQGTPLPDSHCSAGDSEGGSESSKCPVVGNNGDAGKTRQPRNPDGSGPMSDSDIAGAQPSPLTCGEPVEYMVYDFLKGIARRNEHKSFPEPEVAMIFKKSDTENTVDLFDVEMGLRKAYQENPASLTVLNQVGNFWRIKGNTQYAIECFRKALHISSDHPDLLLNLARVLFNLKFYDDAVFLAKRSLHMKSSDSHAWLQYFTLGEVYKALEKYEEAAFYFRKSLQKNPGLHVAEMHLKELGMDQQHSVNIYTVLIILTLVSVVLFLIYYLMCALGS